MFTLGDGSLFDPPFRPRITPVSFVKARRACYEHTNIEGKKVVNHPKTQLNDALMDTHVPWTFRYFPRPVLLILRCLLHFITTWRK